MFYTSVLQFMCCLLSLLIQFIQEKPLWKVGNPYCRVQQSIKIAYWNLKIWSPHDWVSRCRVARWWNVLFVGGKIGFKHIEEVKNNPQQYGQYWFPLYYTQMRFSYIFGNLCQKKTNKIHVYRLLSDTLPLSTHRLPPIQTCVFSGTKW